MLEHIAHFATGYAEFEIDGNGSRFLNLAVKSGLTLWGFQRGKDKKMIARIKARDYKKLRHIKRRCGVKLLCTKKRGLPFFTARVLKRKGLLAGAAVFVMLYFFLGSFVWDVSVSGIDRLTENAVMQAAKEAGVFEGAAKDSFDPAKAAQSIMRSTAGISWISVNTDGCYVKIELKESEKKPEITNQQVPSNIVAETEGQILAIEAQSGMPQVSIGDTVIKGQLLISGIYSEEINPYIEKKQPIVTTIVPARGSVIAETVREFTVSVRREKTEEVVTGEKINRNFLFFGLEIPLGFNTVPKEEHRAYYHRSMLEALGEELPVGLEYDKYVLYEEQVKILTDDEMEEQALFELRALQKEILGTDAKITEETLEYQIVDDLYILVAKCRCEEEIGITQEVLFE